MTSLADENEKGLVNSPANQSDLEAKMRQCCGQQEARENMSTQITNAFA